MASSSYVAVIDRLALVASREFTFAADYVWKAPMLIEQLTSIELNKLARYPNDSKARDFRWEMESMKLRGLYPALLSHGNLFAVCSLFEMYLLQLATDLQPFMKHRLDDTSGQGIARCLAFIRRIGIDANKIELWPQVDAAVKVRNCLMHARGILLYSRHACEIRRMVKNRTFLTREHRKAGVVGADALPRVEIVRSRLGDWLEITNGYSWIVCGYLYNYLLSLCDASKEALRTTGAAS